MDNFNRFSRIYSKHVYYVDGKGFESDKGTRNGKQKAVDYCREHLLPESAIVEFDSEMEFKFFLFLKSEEGKGRVRNIRFHVVFPLVPDFVNKNGMRHNAIDYEADFIFNSVGDDGAEHMRIVDVKGYIEDVFTMKWALFDSRYGSKGWALECYRLKSSGRKNYLDASSWEKVEINTGVRRKSARLEKLKAEKEALEQKLREQKKMEKLLARKKALEEKKANGGKLTSAEKKRLEEIDELQARVKG